MLKCLHLRLNEQGLIDLQTWMIDSTAVRATRASSGARKKGGLTGYDAEALRRHCDQYRMQPVMPLRSVKRKSKPGLPRLFDRPKYRQRNIFERMFGWLKENRRIVTRFDKLAINYAAMVSLACSMRCLRQLFS